MGPFCKKTKFAYQKEWRLLIESKEKLNGFFEFNIGDLSDISETGYFITTDEDLDIFRQKNIQLSKN